MRIDRTLIGLVAGVDEVGKGPLAGPVYAGAVILDPNKRINGLRDSKILTAERREYLVELIKERALAYAVAQASVEEINSLNIFHAGLLAMRRAIDALELKPDHVLVDGTHCPPHLTCNGIAIVDGDALIPAISAASILAKVVRDQKMIELDSIYPGYGFAQHKGYSTKLHLTQLKKLGPSIIHRKAYGPVKAFSNCSAGV